MAFRCCLKHKNVLVFPSTSKCAICCNNVVPYKACKLPCKTCFDIEKGGYSDKLVCLVCKDKICMSNKCPFCNCHMDCLEASSILMEEKDKKCDIMQMIYKYNNECRIVFTTMVMFLMIGIVTTLFTIGVCSQKGKICIACYSFCPFFVIWVWFMVSKLACLTKVHDNINFFMGICMAVAFTLFLSFSYEKNCLFNWDILALFLITCPCCTYCSTRTVWSEEY